MLSNLRRVANRFLYARRNTSTHKKVFANNVIDFSEIKTYGFDYDYTLAHYYKDQVEKFIYQQALDILIKKYRYPSALSRSLKYETNFIIRGLHYDIENKIIMKLDSFSAINEGSTYLGRRPISKAETDEIYESRVIPNYKLSMTSPDHSTGSAMVYKPKASGFHHVHDRFAVPEQALICDVVNWFEEKNEKYDGKVVFNDIRSSVGLVHTSGLLYKELSTRTAEYLPEGGLVKVIDHLLAGKKQLFILTNSPFSLINLSVIVKNRSYIACCSLKSLTLRIHIGFKIVTMTACFSAVELFGADSFSVENWLLTVEKIKIIKNMIISTIQPVNLAR